MNLTRKLSDVNSVVQAQLMLLVNLLNLRYIAQSVVSLSEVEAFIKVH
jgi:hypothetical protein